MEQLGPAAKLKLAVSNRIVSVINVLFLFIIFLLLW